MEFKHNSYPTVGVEQEFHLISATSADLVPACDRVMAGFDEVLRESACYELFTSVLELRTQIHRTASDLLDAVRRDRRKAAEVARREGVLLAAAGSHPFADWRKQLFVDTPHYQWVKRENAYLVNRLLAYGLHVHVGMKSADSALYAMAEFRRWLFPLLAFSTNSPFYEGRDTGLASARTHLFQSMPRSHLPPEFKSLAEFEQLFEKLRQAGDVRVPGEMWWTMRPQPPLGTIEVRTLDLPTDTRRLAVLAALVQAGMAMYQDRFFAGRPPTPLNRAYLEENEWKAMRYGLDTTIIEPLSGELVPMREQFRNLLRFVEPKVHELDAMVMLEWAHELADAPTEADWQRSRALELGGNLRALELEIAERTLVQ